VPISIFFKLLTLIKPKRLAISFASTFGLIWLFLEPAGLFLPEFLNWGWRGYFGLSLLSLAIAVFLSLPQTSIARSLSSPNTIVEIKVGDLFDESGHLVIGANDVFDTALGEVIKPSSVQGQFLTRVYQGDQRRLDSEIDAALEPLKAIREREPHKKMGKSWRYPIGTTLALGTLDKRYFLSAYGFMNNDLRVSSTPDDIWKSLSCLWEQVRIKGHGLDVAIPVIGSDLARTNLPRMALIQLIVISFVAASKKGFVAKKLTVVVYPKDLDSVDLYGLEDFLNSACF
jgi:hypothetical protein